MQELKYLWIVPIIYLSFVVYIFKLLNIQGGWD